MSRGEARASGAVGGTGAAGDRPRAVVTGASSGLGRELARGLARRRYDLVVTARTRAALDELADELRGAPGAPGVAVAVVVADLSDPDAVDALADAVLARGAPALLVNNAGAGRFGAWLDADGDDERARLRLNVEAPTRLARRLVPAMAAAGGGHVLNVASVGGFVPGPLMADYYAAKAYLISWSLALAEEFRGSSIHVTCLAPGPLNTAFQARAGLRKTPSPSSDPPATAARAAPDRWVRAVAEAGIRATLAGRTLVVPGPANRLVAGLAGILPRAWLVRLVHAFQRRRAPTLPSSISP